ncbi:transmembrane 6 superfamily member 1-like [Petromyzon marinus]|uniref:transmembrane 6 superfamily member 1-like n=1 Tax=Petromyzon marinus TaxID=7757 RepID=UPI003F704BB1
MAVSPEVLVVLLSFSAAPVSYALNRTWVMESPVCVCVVGVVVLFAVLGVTKLLLNSPRDPLFYMCAVFMFSCVVDLLLSLEQDGVIKGFMASYVLQGEPYLSTAHGIAICYWDGVIHYLLYLRILHLITHRLPYREVGLYWLGSMLMSMVVFLPGNIIGKYGNELKPSFLLNIPYVCLPLWAGGKILRQPRRWNVGHQTATGVTRPLSERPGDCLFCVYLLFATAFCLFRGLVSLQCPQSICFDYLHLYEPYLRDPTAYPKVQMLVNMLYVSPCCVWLIMAVWSDEHGLKSDLTLLLAGALAQSQTCVLFAGLHHRTAFIYRTSALGPVALNVALALPAQAWALLVSSGGAGGEGRVWGESVGGDDGGESVGGDGGKVKKTIEKKND